MSKNSLLTTSVFLSTLTPVGLCQANDWDLSGGVVIIHQRPDVAHIKNETTASADVILSQQQTGNGWVVHVEAASTLDSMGVANMLPEANSDAGSAQDEQGKGRLQMSELYYQYRFSANQQLSAGLIDVSGFFEQSRIASDEATQFLGASFTGNPIIEFPDYALGAVYQHDVVNGPVLRAAVSSSNGIADNSTRSYSQLLSVREKDKGVFAIVSASWKTPAYLFRLGAWANTAAHSTLDGNSGNADNYGVYLLAGYQHGQHAVNTRFGLANDKVSKASAFTSVGYQYSSGAYVFGAGAARAFLSSDVIDPLLDDTKQYELYLRYALTQVVFLTGDVQRIFNSDFGEQSENRDQAHTVYGLRFSYLFG
jgi:porin